MRIILIILTAVSALSFASCSDADNISDPFLSAAEDTAPVSAAVTSPDNKQNVKAPEKVFIIAEATGYRNGILSFVYDRKTYDLPFEKSKFKGETKGWRYKEPNISELIINNRFGEKVTAQITLNKDMTLILACDVRGPNMKETELKPHPITDDIYKFRRKEGSLCELYNDTGTLEFDLNDLPIYYRVNYPENMENVMAQYYEFKDGKRILDQLFLNCKVTENGSAYSSLDSTDYDIFGLRTGFYGVIRSVNEDNTVTVLLNDKETYCTVPAYFYEGELIQGAEVLLILTAERSLFASGGEHTFDYAVICADKTYFSDGTALLEDLAYAEYKGMDSFRSVTVSNAKRQGDLK